MAANSALNPTLLDLAKAQDPDGAIATVAEILHQQAPMLHDVTVIEGNMTSGHKSTIRTGLPQPTWRRLYEGVQPSKGTTAQIIDNCGNLEAFGEVDCDLAKMSGNVPQYRLLEDSAHIEGMNQEMQSTLIYGNEGTAPAEFTGLAPRFNSLSADNAENIIVGGSSDTDNASIWLVVWGPTTVHGIVPKGSQGGLQIEDMGKQLIQKADGSKFQAFISHYKWQLGLCVRDWRYVVRIPNIDKSALTADAATGASLPDLMFEALEQVQDTNMGRPVFYMNRFVLTKLRQQMSNKVSSSTLTFADVGGHRLLDFQGVPVRRVDALAADEALVA